MTFAFSNNSGNYTIEDPNAGKMDYMAKLFAAIDASVAIIKHQNIIDQMITEEKAAF